MLLPLGFANAQTATSTPSISDLQELIN